MGKSIVKLEKNQDTVVESFQLQMGFSFPFLCAKYLRTSLLIIRTRIFLTLLHAGGTYTRVQGGG